MGKPLTDSDNCIDTSDAAVEAELKRISLIVARRMQQSHQPAISTDGASHAPPFQRSPRHLFNNTSNKMQGDNRRNSLPNMSSTDAAVETKLDGISLLTARRMNALPHPINAPQFQNSSNHQLSNYQLKDTNESRPYENRRNILPGMSNLTQPINHHQRLANVAGIHPGTIGISTDAGLKRQSLADDESANATLRVATNQHLHSHYDAASFGTTHVNTNNYPSNDIPGGYRYSNSFFRPTQAQRMWAGGNGNDSLYDTSQVNNAQLANGLTGNFMRTHEYQSDLPYFVNRRNSLPSMSNFIQRERGVDLQSNHHQRLANIAGIHPAELKRQSVADDESIKAALRVATNQHLRTKHDAASFGTTQVNANNYSSNDVPDGYRYSNSFFRPTQEQGTESDKKPASFDTLQVNNAELANWLTETTILSRESSNNDSGNHRSDRKRSLDDAIGYSDMEEDDILAYYKSLEK